MEENLINFQPREIFVIGESYKPTISEPQARNTVVIGSRYDRQWYSN